MATKLTSVACSETFKQKLRVAAALTDVQMFEILDNFLPLLQKRIDSKMNKKGRK